jgi:hypothetical protein
MHADRAFRVASSRLSQRPPRSAAGSLSPATKSRIGLIGGIWERIDRSFKEGLPRSNAGWSTKTWHMEPAMKEEPL